MRRAACGAPEAGTYFVPVSQAPAPWIQRTEPARRVVTLGTALALTAVVLDRWLTGRLSFFFDLCFVAICLLVAYRVAKGSFYPVTVYPPLLMLGLLVLLALTDRSSVADADDHFVQAVVTGLATHALALAVGYAVCLGVLQSRGDGSLFGLRDEV